MSKPLPAPAFGRAAAVSVNYTTHRLSSFCCVSFCCVLLSSQRCDPQTAVDVADGGRGCSGRELARGPSASETYEDGARPTLTESSGVTLSSWRPENALRTLALLHGFTTEFSTPSPLHVSRVLPLHLLNPPQTPSLNSETLPPGRSTTSASPPLHPPQRARAAGPGRPRRHRAPASRPTPARSGGDSGVPQVPLMAPGLGMEVIEGSWAHSSSVFGKWRPFFLGKGP